MGWLSATIGIVITTMLLALIYLGYSALWCALEPYGIVGIIVFLIFFAIMFVPFMFLFILAILPAIWGIAWD